MHNRWPLVLNALGLLYTHTLPGACWTMRSCSPHAVSAAAVSCARAIPPLNAALKRITTTATTTRQTTVMGPPVQRDEMITGQAGSARNSTCIQPEPPTSLGRRGRNIGTGPTVIDPVISRRGLLR